MGWWTCFPPPPRLAPTASNHSFFLFPLHFMCTCLCCSFFFFVLYFLVPNFISPFILFFEWFPWLTLFLWDLIFCIKSETNNYFLTLYFLLDISLFLTVMIKKNLKSVCILAGQGIGDRMVIKKMCLLHVIVKTSKNFLISSRLGLCAHLGYM